MTDDVRADARRLLQGITPGPWSADWDEADQCWSVTAPPIEDIVCPEVTTVDGRPADAEFIAAAPQLVERLVQRIDDLDAAMVGMHEKANTYTTDIEAERDAALAVIAQVRDQLPIWLDEAWDDGNATGLDGWVGPGRGAGETDDEAVRARRRSTERIAARTILNIVGGEK